MMPPEVVPETFKLGIEQQLEEEARVMVPVEVEEAREMKPPGPEEPEALMELAFCRVKEEPEVIETLPPKGPETSMLLTLTSRGEEREMLPPKPPTAEAVASSLVS